MKTQSKTTSTLATPSITNVWDSKDELKNPGMTEDTVLNLSGTADLNSVVSLYDHSMRVGTASVVAPGVWKISPLAAAVGPHSFTIRAPDGASSPPWVITVGPIELDLEMPTVAQAPGGILDPMNAVASLSVWVPQYDDMRGTDKISVTWTAAAGTPAGGSHTTAPVDVGTVGAKQITLPVSLVAFSLNKSVSVSYTVTRDGKDHGSEVLPLVILPLLASALDKPTVRQAANNGEGPELDVSSLTANGTVRANDWPFIAVVQYVWLQLRGTNADGSVYTKQVWSGGSGSCTNDAWIRDGYYDAAVAQAELKALKDGSSLVVEFKAELGGTREESDAVTFPVRTYTVKALEFATPEPVVAQAPSGILDPIDAVSGATVVVTYNMLPTDTIRLSWNGIDNLVPSQPGSTLGSVTFTIPAPAVAAVIGKTIPVQYAVVRNSVAKPSLVLDLRVQTLSDSVLEAPRILQSADDRNLDIGTLTADADLKVKPWPFIAAGQRISLRFEGTKADGAAYNWPHPMWQNFPITSAGEPSTTVAAAKLKELKAGSSLNLVFEVSFENGGTKVLFPVKSYTITVMPYARTENFDQIPNQEFRVGGIVETPAMTMRFLSGDGLIKISTFPDGYPGYSPVPGQMDGRTLAMSHGHVGNQVLEIKPKALCSKVSFYYTWVDGAANSTLVRFYDFSGNLVLEKSLVAGEVHLFNHSFGMYIGRMEIVTKGDWTCYDRFSFNE